MAIRGNPSILGFHHVALETDKFEETIRFYTEGLGFKERYAWGEGSGRIVLLDVGDGNYLEVFAREPKEPGAGGRFFHVALRTDDVDGAVEAAKAAGAVVTVEPKDVVLKGEPPTPVRIAFVRGVAGEIIEFFQSTGENQL